MGEDFNFPLGNSAIWGDNALVDPLTDLFVRRLEDSELIDIEPIKLKPTWTHKRI